MEPTDTENRNPLGESMPGEGEEPNTMDVTVHEDGHDLLDGEKTSSQHPDGPIGDATRGIGVPGTIGEGPSSAADLARDAGAEGPVDQTDTQPGNPGDVLTPHTSTDGG
jgi:hypothetical protein